MVRLTRLGAVEKSGELFTFPCLVQDMLQLLASRNRARAFASALECAGGTMNLLASTSVESIRPPASPMSSSIPLIVGCSDGSGGSTSLPPPSPQLPPPPPPPRHSPLLSIRCEWVGSFDGCIWEEKYICNCGGSRCMQRRLP